MELNRKATFTFSFLYLQEHADQLMIYKPAQQQHTAAHITGHDMYY